MYRYTYMQIYKYRYIYTHIYIYTPDNFEKYLKKYTLYNENKQL